MFGVIPVDNVTSCSQILTPQQSPIKSVVLQEGCLAVRGCVYVSVVTNGQQRLQGMFHHAGHRHSNKTVCLFIFKHVATLAVQEEHNGLQEHRQTDRRTVMLAFPLHYCSAFLWFHYEGFIEGYCFLKLKYATIVSTVDFLFLQDLFKSIYSAAAIIIVSTKVKQCCGKILFHLTVQYNINVLILHAASIINFKMVL